jgi:hypothetical protein
MALFGLSDQADDVVLEGKADLATGRPDFNSPLREAKKVVGSSS